MIHLSILTISRSNENLKKLIDSLPAATSNTIKYEIIISWNGDQPCTIEQSSDTKVINIKPYNFSANNNVIAKHASNSTLLFINDDVILDKNSIATSAKYFIDHKDIGILGINLRYSNDNIQHAGMFINDQGNPYHIYKNEIHFLDPRARVICECDAITGAFILTNKNDFFLVGGFDENCAVAAQDVILSINFRKKLQKKIVYYGMATAIHYENVTRKLFDQKTTPENDILIMKESINQFYANATEETNEIKIRIVTEKPGWILHRKAEEIAKRMSNAKINQDYPEANIHYYINYGYFNKRPPKGIVIANFTHYDPDLHADKWVSVAKEVDHCTAVSEEAKSNLLKFNIPEEKITVIKVGADISFKPLLKLGIVGRVYGSGRKGENLVAQLLQDKELMQDVKIVSTSDSWGVSVWEYEDMGDFYRNIDFLLIPSLIEGGPVPFMEALACGTISIAPPIGVIPEFPHIEYETGNITSLKNVINQVKKSHLQNKQKIARAMKPYNWNTWASEHISLFKRIIQKKFK